MTSQKQAYVYGLSAVLLWSTVATAFKLALQYLDPIQLLLYASATSTLVLGFVVVVQGKARHVFLCTRRQYMLSLVLGLLNPCFYYLVLFKAYDLLPAQEAQPLNYTWAITLALLSIPLLKQKLSKWDIIGSLVAYGGVFVISTHGDILSFTFSDSWGVALALFSTVLWALYWIFNTRDTRDSVVGLFLGFAFALPFVFVICWVFSDVWVADIRGIYGAVYAGVIEMGITFVLWLSALKRAKDTARVGNLIFLSPFLSLVFIHFLLGEHILPSTFVGLLLIVVGLLVQQMKSKRHLSPALS
ncbi:MAG: DMT family transporter [Candidatus Latescibacteria bacterium]|jgi:drug/metabolite transporter (DMT)-like permease|nr:DMT family transporter [Candidatus Latescibacterota bacterium]MBT4137354.1 DMT family transporter [Candidatus Latescibacterota bacterium]MBT5829059.1 DMT family transporter [Candidatus Latescibacterota bacterium]